MGKNTQPRIVFRKQDTIGAADAAEDELFLEACFVDTGALSVLRDPKRSERIVVGRTGSGKTALLRRLAQTPNVIEVKPENLALAHISNSNILRFFADVGVNLEIFYKLLWRHCFCVELLRHKFGKDPGIFARLQARFKGKEHSRALAYLRKYGEHFWKETDVRLKEITSGIEESLRTSLGSETDIAQLANEARHSEERRSEVVNRAQKVVQEAHVAELQEILSLVDAVFDDAQNPHLIVIDRLDENWVDDAIRYRLIMALIDTVKEFRAVKNAKIIIGTRVDLLRHVFTNARGPGFQEEKLENLYVRLEWKTEGLKDLLDRRVNHVLRDRYSGRAQVTHRDVFQKDPAGQIAYVLKRTFMRPRDVITFFNTCIRVANEAQISRQHVVEAEGIYSNARLVSLADEWRTQFPALDVAARLLFDKRASPLKYGDLDPAQIKSACVEYSLRRVGPEQNPSGILDAAQDITGTRAFIRNQVHALFFAGLVELKLHAGEHYISGLDEGALVDPSKLRPTLPSESTRCFIVRCISAPRLKRHLILFLRRAHCEVRLQVRAHVRSVTVRQPRIVA